VKETAASGGHSPRLDSESASYLAPSNDDTTLLTPVSDNTSAIDRIPVRRHRLLTILTWILGITAAGAIALSVYLWQTTDDWRATNTELRGIAGNLGTRVSDQETSMLEQDQQITLFKEQLTTAQNRIIELASEKNATQDDAAAFEQINNYLEDLSSTAASVALALNRCVEEQTILIGALQQPDNYDPVELADYKVKVAALCEDARLANEVLQTELAKPNAIP